jgi:hypothetical protein
MVFIGLYSDVVDGDIGTLMHHNKNEKRKPDHRRDHDDGIINYGATTLAERTMVIRHCGLRIVDERT